MALTRRTLLALPLAAAAPKPELQPGTIFSMASTLVPPDIHISVGDTLTFEGSPHRYRVHSIVANAFAVSMNLELDPNEAT